MDDKMGYITTIVLLYRKGGLTAEDAVEKIRKAVEAGGKIKKALARKRGRKEMTFEGRK